MKTRRSLFFLWSTLLCLAGILAVACTAFGPAPIADPTQRLDFHSLSVLPPQGPNWSIIPKAPGNVAWGKKLFDTPRRPADRLHTFVAGAIVSDWEAENRRIWPLVSPTQIQEHINRYFAQGGRFRILEYKQALDRSLGVDCVRPDVVYEERDNPRAPGSVLVISVHGFMCRHPHVPTLGIILFYSERFVEGEQSLLTETLKQEAEAFLRSVVFKPVQ